MSKITGNKRVVREKGAGELLSRQSGRDGEKKKDIGGWTMRGEGRLTV